MSTLLEIYTEDTRRFTEIYWEDGLPIIRYTQDIKPIVEQCKREASNFQGTNREGFTKVASIPGVIWQRIVQTGIAHDQAALNAWLDERDNRVFRTDDARRL